MCWLNNSRTNLDLEPHDFRINYVNIDLRQQYGIFVAKTQTSLLAKHPYRRGERLFSPKQLSFFSMSQAGGGGALGYFLDGYVPPGTPNWHPVPKKNSPKIDTPF